MGDPRRDSLAELLYEAWCNEFNPEPSWLDEEPRIHQRWANVANEVRYTIRRDWIPG